MASAMAATRAACPTVGCGLVWWKRYTRVNEGGVEMGKSLDRLRRASATRSSSLRPMWSAWAVPPTNTRRSTVSAGARAGHFDVTQVLARISMPSRCGTTKPVASSLWGTAARGKAKNTVAAEPYGMAESAAAARASTPGDEASGGVGREPEHDVVGVEGARVGVDGPAGVGVGGAAPQGAGGRGGVYDAVGQRGGEGVDEAARAAAQRHEGGGGRGAGVTLRRGEGRGAQEARVAGGHGEKLREGLSRGEGPRVACVDAGQQGLGEGLDHLASEATADEVAEGDVAGRRRARGQHEVEGEAGLAAQGQERRPERRTQPRGHAEHHALGHGLEAAAVGHVHPAVVRDGLDEVLAEPQGPTERGGFGFGRDPTVGAAVNLQVAVALGDEVAAEARGGLQHGHGHRARRRAVQERTGDGEARQPAADDDHPLRHRPPHADRAEASCTKSASA
jgi:hypothetical protein